MSSFTLVAQTVRLILGDQLNPEHSWFGKKDPSVTYVFMEVRSETDYVVHHAQKVIAIFAGMRRLAEQLGKQGHLVRYFRLGDKDNLQKFAENLNTVFACVSSEHFLDGRGGVAAHFQKDAKRWLMESYYRKMRVRTRLLMDEDGTPAGGEWNYDKENRKPWKGTPPPPKSWDISHDHSAIWAEIQAAGVKTMGKPSENAGFRRLRGCDAHLLRPPVPLAPVLCPEREAACADGSRTSRGRCPCAGSAALSAGRDRGLR
ncbi:MAG: cryptochrome/photolyase family protein [Verrucomicrobia bacterium]|nr:cryptochrome/photolyase family protein [Verrucomicrobiota bacterium]